jgi:bacterioferritin
VKAVVWHGIGDIRLDTVPDPGIREPTDAVIRITRSAICGTEHATEERQHMERAAERISQLGGAPDLSPGGVSKSHTEYVAVKATDLTKMLEENLVAERIVITSYQEIIRWLGDSDPTTRRLMESILEEEEHADDLNDLLGN